VNIDNIVSTNLDSTLLDSDLPFFATRGRFLKQNYVTEVAKPGPSFVLGTGLDFRRSPM
jgi:hypothetical protein